jgi:ribosome-dependent ATPase
VLEAGSVSQNAQPIVSARQLSHAYKKVRALDDISLDVPAGRMVGLLGPDGVGKSTLLGLIAGARKMQQGTLHVLGGDMAAVRHRNAVGPRIAYMPQGLGKNLYQELSVAENLDFFGKLFGQGRAERNARIDRLTRATGLYPFLARPAGKLSGGMKQKLGLCCALIHDPDLLILDEPTTGVDPLSRRQFWELIEAIRAERDGMSVLVSTAYMDEADGFDWLVAMDGGRILDTGTPAELKAKTGASDLEAAFVQLLPEGKRDGASLHEIAPREKASGPPAIVAKGLTRRFGDFTAVDQVSFEIEQGEIFGFLGSNGCGKTTTMKMLTGLLPASEGEAFLFGKPVDANDLETRKRVGFMSQSFSLYGELTVAQNLKLHARLFEMTPAKTAVRIDELVRRFALGEHVDALASALPLGIRQRLSLAVAIIHEPEMLILDEPTSGVDPIARDGFWELLIELSRRDKVTIFISTHFMNEALRCDRISLMHAGQVLVYDEPAHLVEAKGAQSLEAAFISYIEEAIGDDGSTGSVSSGALSTGELDFVERKSAGHNPWGFSPTRALAYSYREAMEVMRDPVRLAFAFLGSMVLLILMAYGISSDVDQVTYAALDLDRTPASRAYLRNYSGSRYFIKRPDLKNKDELETRLKSNDITLAIEIPPGFGRSLKKAGRLEISAWIDGANATRSGTIEGYVSGAHTQFLTKFARSMGRDFEASQIAKIEPRYRYNPSFESIYAMGPSIPALLLLLIPAILMAVSVAREKEIGTITNFYVTPTSRLEFLLGKQLPYVAIGMINFAILTLIVIFVMQVPLKGSLLALSCGALLYVMASTGYGLLISMVTKSQVAAVFAGAILSMLPTMQFSGMLQPVSTLEGGARVIGTLWPTTYFMHLSIGAFTKGLGFGDLAIDLVALTAFVPVFVLIAAGLLRKQEA